MRHRPSSDLPAEISNWPPGHTRKAKRERERERERARALGAKHGLFRADRKELKASSSHEIFPRLTECG